MVKDQLTSEIQGFDKLVQKYKQDLMDEVFNVRDDLNVKINEMFSKIIRVESDNSTTRALVKGQNE